MKIVLTGGPSAGKTTIAEALVRAYRNRLALVPESATVLYRGGFPRDTLPAAIACQQRAIYRVQVELEAAAELRHPDLALVCDRGTMDGVAFWPFEETDFFREMGTRREREFARYDWVIHLQTAAPHAYLPSAIRRETYEEAHAIDEKLQKIWSAHPRWIRASNGVDFSVKISRVLLAIDMILKGQPEQRIRDLLAVKDHTRP